MANLAIKGHETRGKEVIEILKMLGGNTSSDFTISDFFYYIDENQGIKGTNYISHYEAYKAFTLERFLEKFPYKIGDIVKIENIDYQGKGIIKELFWDEEKGIIRYGVDDGCINFWNTEDLQPCKEEIMEDEHVYTKLDFNHEPAADKVELILGDYEIRTEGEKTYLVRTKPTYPKTFKECCDVLDIKCGMTIDLPLNYAPIIHRFTQLIICYDAYRKIIGNEMGLGKPWEPDWKNSEERKYCIVNTEGNITKWVQKTTHKILAFPTEEISDVFYENFIDLIEQCKELL